MKWAGRQLSSAFAPAASSGEPEKPKKQGIRAAFLPAPQPKRSVFETEQELTERAGQVERAGRLLAYQRAVEVAVENGKPLPHPKAYGIDVRREEHLAAG